MVPTAFDEDNDVLGPPKGLTEDDVTSLSIHRGVVNGHAVVVSCWKASKEELAEIARTGRVWLVVAGGTMYPAYLLGTNPFVKS